MGEYRKSQITAQSQLAKGKDINAIDKDGKTILMHASIEGKTEVARFLIENGANVNTGGKKFGLSALGWVASKGHSEIVELLVDNQADVNAEDKFGNTA